MKLKLNISLFVLLTFTMSTVFAMTFTTTQAGANSSKDISVQVGKQYQLKFDLQHQTTSAVRIQILEGSNKIVDASNLADGSHVYSFTPTSNTVTLRFIREDNDNVSRDFEVNNLLYEEVLSTIQAESNHVIGRKEYELADHLGNVRAVISDKPKNGNAEVISATDYLPFGMTARSYSNGSETRYGYSGKEKESEISEGDYDFGARINSVKLARWLACDPLKAKYPELSPYNCVGNSPLLFVDPDGKRIIGATEESAKFAYADIITSVYGSNAVMKDVFVLNGNEIVLSEQYAKMSRNEFHRFIRNQYPNTAENSGYLRSYSYGMYKAITSKKSIKVTYTDGTVSQAKYAADNNGNMEVEIAKNNGIPTDVICDGAATPTVGSTTSEFDRRITAAHEILGEALVRIEKGLLNDAQEAQDPVNNTTYIDVQSIKVSNVMAKILKVGFQRTGSDHAVETNKELLKQPIPDDMKSIINIPQENREQVKKEEKKPK
jgi:RHS repeat-associated protein